MTPELGGIQPCGNQRITPVAVPTSRRSVERSVIVADRRSVQPLALAKP